MMFVEIVQRHVHSEKAADVQQFVATEVLAVLKQTPGFLEFLAVPTKNEAGVASVITMTKWEDETAYRMAMGKLESAGILQRGGQFTTSRPEILAAGPAALAVTGG